MRGERTQKISFKQSFNNELQGASSFTKEIGNDKAHNDLE
jgi:hypothetical protein